jgi:hypothetical protein
MHKGKVSRLGFKRWIVREVAGVAVQVVVDRNVNDDFVLDIVVGYGDEVASDKVAEVEAWINNNRNEILAIFGY